MTPFEQGAVVIIGAQWVAIGAMARYIVTMIRDREKRLIELSEQQKVREDTIHAQCRTARQAQDQLLHEARADFTAVLLKLSGIENSDNTTSDTGG